ncbi:hypothetical protein YC2023_114999 [Brassica napus]
MVVLANTDTYLPGQVVNFTSILVGLNALARNSQLYFTRNWWPQVVVATNVNPKLVEGIGFP